MLIPKFFRSPALCIALLSTGICATAGEISPTLTGDFLQSLTKSDYDASGLGKLTQAERARLNSLVNAYTSCEYQQNQPAPPTAAAQPASKPAPSSASQPSVSAMPTATTRTPVAPTPTAAPMPAPATANAPVQNSKTKKVKIDPGTEVEYNTIDTEIAGVFDGFEKGTIFTLTNGQRWKVIDGNYVCGPDPKVRKVHVRPGVLGSFFLEFEGVRVRAKVQLIK